MKPVMSRCLSPRSKGLHVLLGKNILFTTLCVSEIRKMHPREISVPLSHVNAAIQLIGIAFTSIVQYSNQPHCASSTIQTMHVCDCIITFGSPVCVLVEDGAYNPLRHIIVHCTWAGIHSAEYMYTYVLTYVHLITSHFLC